MKELGGSFSLNSLQIAKIVGVSHSLIKSIAKDLLNQGFMKFISILKETENDEELFVFSGQKGKRESLLIAEQISPQAAVKLTQAWNEFASMKQKPAVTCGEDFRQTTDEQNLTGELQMNSLEIAQITGISHTKVKKAIRRIQSNYSMLNPSVRSVQSSDSAGKQKTTQVYVFSGEKGKRDGVMIAGGLHPAAPLKVLRTWEENEQNSLNTKQSPERKKPETESTHHPANHLTEERILKNDNVYPVSAEQTSVKTGYPVPDGEMKEFIERDSEGRFNLNLLHKMSQEGLNKNPGRWLRNKQTIDLIEQLEDNLLKNKKKLNSVYNDPNLDHGQNIIKKSIGGKNPGIFAHELLAYDYAAWISPVFRLRVYEVFREYKEGKLTSESRLSEELDNPEFLRNAILRYTEKTTELQKQASEQQQLLILREEEAKESAEKLREKEKLLKQSREKAEAFTQIAEVSSGSMQIRDVAKILNIKPKLLFTWLADNHWIFRQEKRVLATQGKINAGHLEQKLYTYIDSSGSKKISSKVTVTPKGIAFLALKFPNQLSQ